jgi:choline dehydrogenase-like flavoprotein
MAAHSPINSATALGLIRRRRKPSPCGSSQNGHTHGADGDSDAVLDARMRVRGIENLRVSDMSAVPNINAGNTNAPAMMLGDRCADFVLGHG